jgi:uncharacterized RDD family membrane protein YckC
VSQRPAGLRPTLLRRLASLGYETLVVAAILIAGGLAFLGVAAAFRAVAGVPPASAPGGLERVLLQVLLVVLLGAYYVRCWTRGGQTLALKAWKLRVVGPAGGALTTRAAIARFAIAGLALGTGVAAFIWLWRHPGSMYGWAATLPAAADVLWAALDRDRQFLHDRLARTRVVRA